jgi:hypothetical protein
VLIENLSVGNLLSLEVRRRSWAFRFRVDFTACRDLGAGCQAATLCEPGSLLSSNERPTRECLILAESAIFVSRFPRVA